MTRTCPPYSSSARLSRLPARLEWHGRRPAPPCPRRRRCDSRETRRRWRYRATAAYGPVAQPLLFLLKQRLKLIGHFRQGRRLGEGQQRVQIEREMPPWIILHVAVDIDILRAFFQPCDGLQGLLQFRFDADDADQILHALLEIGVNGIGILLP